MERLIDLIAKSEEINSVISGVEAGLSEQLVSGTGGSARSFYMASLYKRTKKSQIIVTHNLFQAQKLYDDLSELVSENEIFLYPVNDLIASEIAIASPELKGQRLEVLNHWSRENRGIVIVPVAGFRRILPPKAMWKSSQISLLLGEEIDLDHFLGMMLGMGFERTSMVTTPGQFSIRGGIIDIYPLTEENPVRIELFDTDIDSLRYFDAESQRSFEKTLEQITYGPAKETLLFDEQYDRAAMLLKEELAKTLKTVKDKKIQGLLSEQIGHELEQLQQHQPIDQYYKYMSLYYEKKHSLLDYLPKDGLVLIDELSRVYDAAERLEKEEAEWQTTLLTQGGFLANFNLSHSFQELMAQNNKPIIYFTFMMRHVTNTNPQKLINLPSQSMQNFHGQLHLLKNELDRWQRANQTVVFLAADQERAKRLRNALYDYKIEADISRDGIINSERPQIIASSVSAGFELPMLKLVVITESEVFKQRVRKPVKKQKMSNAERIKSYSELKVGDYVVHVNHGIGKYLGIKTLDMNGIHKDYLHLKYAGNDQLYVPVDQIEQVQKFVGSEGKDPKIYALGGSDWKKVKNKVRSSVEDIADDLIKLYAAREAAKGYAFSEDSSEQREFEDSFPYQETDDQIRTINEIKKDMEDTKPMDRLLCGDVGYGKTEVAIRAAFKAIVDGKQVAFLVPTTILAQQHYETLTERFQDHAINIGLLSRFRTKAQQAETTKGLKAGTVDIVVGTHRLLSKDVTYRDLGLLIIDEEQRFGVKHKEKLKQLKTNVDVLTLTATPIPRTLHMSLLGVRDLSVIETPPENRYPVQTYVVESNPGLIREAIEREMARDGQVFYLYNKVEGIEKKAESLSMLAPEAKIAYAHGQMNENELEAVILDFLEGHYDVLVSTTIIETGVDIPNVNTLIVEDADKMGLSQLYQLRGRVGRSNRVAYAYFTYQRDKVLTEVAEKRLQAIKEFTELGSGFKIAMRDLAIRGAGNLLGAQQHGYIDSVGFDLYSQMLQEAIEEKRGLKKEEKTPDVELNLEVDAYIPDHYIEDSKQKIDMYKRFRALQTKEDIFDLQSDMIDRFGEYPGEVEDLFRVASIKILSQKHKVESISERRNVIEILFTEEGSNETDPALLYGAVTDFGRKFQSPILIDHKKFKVGVNAKGIAMSEALLLVEKFLIKMKDLKRDTISSS
ncbi:transcription-repair coupling factor [Lottiidibacillus patelloidae]|uniref:Transcription-repair-coupling factor n=1 Tax=Lottiidibacillus patelloidae TaxID=2670334 RepID=A0A263BQ11_9BACI|nr:transcription-repair coupling factor [Lottiidibacillus patelloidae]OZM55841.1 transcription-repair coupling factor [Lottiidibacillus patelloidae]